MGMGTHVVGFRPADEKWNGMKAVWDACIKAGIDCPENVEKFFDHEYPGDKPGQEVGLEGAVNEWRDDYRDGFEIDVSKLPANVRFLRFYNSW